MSADDYLLVRPHNGGWTVTRESASADEPAPVRSGSRGSITFPTREEALDYAATLDPAEYGIQVTGQEHGSVNDDSTDLVSRLREVQGGRRKSTEFPRARTPMDELVDLCGEAADRIEYLEAAVSAHKLVDRAEFEKLLREEEEIEQRHFRQTIAERLDRVTRQMKGAVLLAEKLRKDVQ